MSGTYWCEYTIFVYNDVDTVKIKCPNIATPTLPNHRLWSYGDGQINVKWGGLIKKIIKINIFLYYINISQIITKGCFMQEKTINELVVGEKVIRYHND